MCVCVWCSSQLTEKRNKCSKCVALCAATAAAAAASAATAGAPAAPSDPAAAPAASAAPVAATAAAIKRIFIEKTHSCHTQQRSPKPTPICMQHIFCVCVVRLCVCEWLLL